MQRCKYDQCAYATKRHCLHSTAILAGPTRALCRQQWTASVCKTSKSVTQLIHHRPVPHWPRQQLGHSRTQVAKTGRHKQKCAHMAVRRIQSCTEPEVDLAAWGCGASMVQCCIRMCVCRPLQAELVELCRSDQLATGSLHQPYDSLRPSLPSSSFQPTAWQLAAQRSVARRLSRA